MKTSPVTADLQPLPKRDFLRLLICGEHDKGRVDFATSFPNSVIIDASGTLCEADDRPDVPILRSADLDTIEEFIRKISAGFLAPETLVIDGFSNIAEALDAKVKNIKGYDNYATKCERYTNLMNALRALPCHVVIVTRIRQELSRPGSIFGGKLVSDTERIIVGTGPEIHKPLLEYFDVVFEVIRAYGGRSMAVVKTSILGQIESDEIVAPNGLAVVERLATERPAHVDVAPTPKQYLEYLRLGSDAVAAGLTPETLKAIRKMSVVPAAERISPYLCAVEIDEINARLLAYLASVDPLTLGTQNPDDSDISAEMDTGPESDSTTHSNVVAITPGTGDAPVRPSSNKPEWLEVKERLSVLNALLDEHQRSDTKITNVTEFLRHNQLFTDTTPGGQILCTSANAKEALRLLDERIAKITPLELPVAS